MVNRIFSNLPKIIILWWVFLFVIMHTDFYYYNYMLISKIDVPFIAISILHFIVFPKYYTIKKLIFVVGIFFILFIQVLSDFISEKLYYTLYISTLIITINAQLLINGQRRN